MVHSEFGLKYGEGTCAAGEVLHPDTFNRFVERSDALDQYFTKAWLEFAVGGMGMRPQLDQRTRALVLVGQYTMARSNTGLEDAIKGALNARVPAREVLEVVLQCVVYGGWIVVEPAMAAFHRIARERGLLDGLRDSQLPLDGRETDRSLAEERKTWHPADIADPRFTDLMERHGWLAVGRGLTLRPRHHLNVLSWLDGLDSDFAGLWVKFVYGAMYSRGILDDKTRLLCIIADCLAVREETQARGHMRGAIRNGADPREIMEICFLTAVNFGMPSMLKALEVFVEIMTEENRLDEIGNPRARVETYNK